MMTNKLKKIALSVGSMASAMALSASTVMAQIDIGGSVNSQKGYASEFGPLLNSVLTFVMVLAALMVFLYLIWGGIQWITSGGDKGKTEEARNKITAAVIGLIILAASWAILLVVLRFLGFSDFNDVFNKTKVIS